MSEALDLQDTARELHAVIGKLKRRLREQATVGDYTWSQISVVVRLDREGPATVTSLARAEGIRPQSMGETVATLKAAGLIESAPDPSDGRQTVLSLTPACKELIRTGRAARVDWLVHAIEAHLNAAEQQQLASAVALLQRIAGA